MDVGYAARPVPGLDERPMPGLDERPMPGLDERPVPGLDERTMPGLDERTMALEPGAVLDDGVEFTHEYDSGTTTESSLRVVERDDHHCGLGVTADYGDAPVRLLARKEMSDVRCGVCGDEATAVCPAHTYDETGWLYEDCQADHECRPAMFLPVVNSPRVGMCGYSG